MFDGSRAHLFSKYGMEARGTFDPRFRAHDW